MSGPKKSTSSATKAIEGFVSKEAEEIIEKNEDVGDAQQSGDESNAEENDINVDNDAGSSADEDAAADVEADDDDVDSPDAASGQAEQAVSKSVVKSIVAKFSDKKKGGSNNDAGQQAAETATNKTPTKSSSPLKLLKGFVTKQAKSFVKKEQSSDKDDDKQQQASGDQADGDNNGDNSASGNDNDGEATNNDDAAAPADGDNGDPAAPADGDNGDDNNGDNGDNNGDDGDDNDGDDGDDNDNEISDAAGGDDIDISDVGKGFLGSAAKLIGKNAKKMSLKGAAKKVSAANKFMKGLITKEAKKLVKDEAKDDDGQDAEEAADEGDANDAADQAAGDDAPADGDDGGDDGGDAGGGDDADADPSGGGVDLGLEIGGVDLDDVIPAGGPIVKALFTRLSSDPSKRKTFKKQMSEASYKLRDKVYRRYQGIHFSPKPYAYYFTWSAYDLKKYCFMLGLDFRKHPAKTTVAAAVAFVGKHGSKKTIQYTVGYLPGVNSCIDATFSRYDKVKMLIEHLEKWCVLVEDFLPSNREEWETFIKVHAEIAAKRSADYPPDTAPWTTEQEATFVDKLRTLHNKDQMLPMKVCDVLGAGVPKKIPTKRNFDYEKMDDSPMFYSYFRKGFTGMILKAFYGGSWDVCQMATKAIREANVPFDTAFDLLKRPVEVKRKWGEYVRSIFLAARQKYVKRPPLDWKAFQEILDNRVAIEKFIVQRNAERKLKRQAEKKQKAEAAAAKKRAEEEQKIENAPGVQLKLEDADVAKEKEEVANDVEDDADDDEDSDEDVSSAAGDNNNEGDTEEDVDAGGNEDAPGDAVNDAPDEAANDAPDEAVNDAPDEAVNDAPGDAVNDAPDEAVNDVDGSVSRPPSDIKN